MEIAPWLVPAKRENKMEKERERDCEGQRDRCREEDIDKWRGKTQPKLGRSSLP